MPAFEIEALAGRTIGGYVLKSKLGQGGMGVVYLAVQKGLRREVALKLLPVELVGKAPQCYKRFLREAGSCARMSHPNIVKVFDFGADQGYYFYTMEVLRARSLREYLDEVGIAPMQLVLRTAREMAAAMEHYHPLGVIHRDIKPGNIMLGEDGRLVLTDFGLAKELGATALTRAGCTVGTPFYLAPEMIRGLAWPSSDIWQLGVVLYQMATKRLPFWANNTGDLLRKITQEDPLAPTHLNPELPEPVQTLILNCLERDQAVRYGDASELAADAAAVEAGEPIRLRRDERRGQALGAVAVQAGAGVAPAGRPVAPARGNAPQGLVGAAPGGDASGHRAPKPAGRVRTNAPMRFGWALGVAAAVLLSVGAVAGWRLTRPQEVAAIEVVCRAGPTAALVEWRTTVRCRSAVEWGKVGARSMRQAPSPEEGLAHKASLEPLEPGGSYRYCLVLPGGQRSLEHDFVAPKAPVTPLAFSAGDFGVKLEFATAQPAAASLSGGPGMSVSGSTVSSRHTLCLTGTFTGWAPLTLEVPDATGARRRLSGNSLAAVWREALLEPMAQALAAKLDSYKPHDFLYHRIDRFLPPPVCTGASVAVENVGFGELLLGTSSVRSPHYGKFTPGEPYAGRLAGDMALHVDGQAHTPLLRSLAKLAPDFWTARRLSTSTATALHGGLRKLAEFDYYAGFLRIPFETGVRETLGAEWQSSCRRTLPSTARSAIVSAPAGGIWAHPYREAAALKKADIRLSDRQVLSEHVFEVRLPEGPAPTRAELTLHRARLETELCFRVQVNDGPVLDLRHEPQREIPQPSKFRPDLSMPFDARFLRAGRNWFRVSISAVAGTRFLGLKSDNYFTALGLSWETR